MLLQRKNFLTLVLPALFAVLSACGGAGGGGSSSGEALDSTTPRLTEEEKKPSASGLYKGPKAFEKYVATFIANAKKEGVDVTPHMKNPTLVMKIASLDSYGSSTIGLCQSSASVRRVTIDPDFWNSASAASREQVIHHELGHCVLDRRHVSTKLSSGIAKSMMYPSILSNTTYTKNKSYYLNELFTSPLRGWDADGVAPTVTIATDADDAEPGVTLPAEEHGTEDVCAFSAEGVL